MDVATSEIYSAFFVDEEGTMSSFRALSEAIRAKSLYADRASYWNTPEAGGKVARTSRRRGFARLMAGRGHVRDSCVARPRSLRNPGRGQKLRDTSATTTPCVAKA